MSKRPFEGDTLLLSSPAASDRSVKRQRLQRTKESDSLIHRWASRVVSWVRGTSRLDSSDNQNPSRLPVVPSIYPPLPAPPPVPTGSAPRSTFEVDDRGHAPENGYMPPSSSTSVAGSSSDLGEHDLAGLTAHEPIDLTEDPDEGSQTTGASDRGGEESRTGGGAVLGKETERSKGSAPTHTRQVSTASSSRLFRAAPVRPIIPKSDHVERKYGWMGPRVASGPEAGGWADSRPRDSRSVQHLKSSSKSRSTQARKSDRNSGATAKKSAALRRIRKLLSNPSRKAEAEFLQQTEAGGADSKEALRKLISSPRLAASTNSRSIDAIVKPRTDRFDPKKTQASSSRAAAASLGEYVTPPDIAEIIDRLKLELEEDEERLRSRLEPSVPVSLSAAEEAEVTKALSDPDFKRTTGTAMVEAPSLRRLRPNIWLDDEVINFYGGLLQVRANSDQSGKFPSIHYFNTFFYAKMDSAGYTKMLARWTKKVDIFSKDLVVFPINLGNAHWVAAVINMNKRRVEYYDSMGIATRMARHVFDLAMQYLEAEHLDKKGIPYNTDDWDVHNSGNTPQQDNGNDCGIFSCQTLEAVTRGKDLTQDKWEFSSKDMPFLRRMMVYEISQGKLYNRW